MLKIERTFTFSVNWCDDDETLAASSCRMVSSEENGTLFKCLHGTYSPVNLYVPENCSFGQFANQKDCPTDLEWTRLMNEKCVKSGQAYLRDFRFMQWCNALTGGRLSGFVGVEYVCCNVTVPKPGSHTTSPNEDDNIDYVNEESSNVSKINDESIKVQDDNGPRVAPVVSEDEDEDGENSNGGGSSKFFTILMALVIVLTLVIIVFKRRMRRSASQLMVPVNVAQIDGLETNQIINSMQVTGYENPTYKYFEMQN